MRLSDRILDILFPPRCAFCGALTGPEEEGVCLDCRRTLPRYDHARRRIDFIGEVNAPLNYVGAVRQAVIDYKFHDRQGKGRPFGRLIAADLLSRDGTDCDIVTWAPLSRRRERKRGYDQARVLAEAAAEVLNLPAVPLLAKIRDVPAQSGLTSPEARRANVSGVYIAEEGHRAEGKRVLLIDDIITTGATVSECARMLMLAGAGRVDAAALAIRPRE